MHSALPVLTCVHLPHIDGAVGASHHQVVVRRTPLDDLDGEEVSRRQHDALPLPETEQADRVVAGHRADTVLHPGLRRKHSGKPFKSNEVYLKTRWSVTDTLVEETELNLDPLIYFCSL